MTLARIYSVADVRSHGAAAGESNDSGERVASRHELATFVWYKIVGSSDGTDTCEGMARSCDASRSGIGLVTSRALPLGARLFVEIVVPEGNLSVVGTIVHCSSQPDGLFRVGVRLEIVPPNDRQTLARMVAE